jgi:hypothetical protein
MAQKRPSLRVSDRRAPTADSGSTDARHRSSPVSTPDRRVGRETESILFDQERL